MGSESRETKARYDQLRMALGNATAYYLWPPVWVGGEPTATGMNMNLNELTTIVYERQIQSSMSMKVHRDGMFIFDLSSWERGIFPLDMALQSQETIQDAVQAMMQSRVELLNAHLACLYTAIGRIDGYALGTMTLSPWNIIDFETFDGQMKPVSPRSDDLLQRLYMLKTENDPNYLSGSPILSGLRIGMRPVISIAAVEEAFRLFLVKLQSPNARVLLFVDLYMRACKAYEDYNDSVCLVTAWTLIESLLQQKWNQYIESNRRQIADGTNTVVINADRRGTLLGRDFTASIVAEILSLAALLPFELYKDITTVRQARNRWMHSLKSVARKDARLSISVAERMMTLVEDLDLHVPVIPHIDL